MASFLKFYLEIQGDYGSSIVSISERKREMWVEWPKRPQAPPPIAESPIQRLSRTLSRWCLHLIVHSSWNNILTSSEFPPEGLDWSQTDTLGLQPSSALADALPRTLLSSQNPSDLLESIGSINYPGTLSLDSRVFFFFSFQIKNHKYLNHLCLVRLAFWSPPILLPHSKPWFLD